jgi:hypothetical protein
LHLEPKYLMEPYCVYVTYHLTGKFYVGKGVTKAVISGKYKGSGKLLHDAFKKYPKSQWYCQVLTTHNSENEAYTQEALIVTEELLKHPRCLNYRVGGMGWTRSEILRRNAVLWQNPEYQVKMSLLMKDRWLDAKFVDKIRSATSANAKKQWANPEYRARMTRVSNTTVEKTWRDSEFQSEMSKRAWAKPEVRKKQAELLKRRFEETDIKQKLIDGAKRKWQDPDFRQKESARRSTRMSSVRWVCKDGIAKQVKIEELDSYISIGWKRGMK